MSQSDFSVMKTKVNEGKRRLLFSKTILYGYGNGQSESPSHFSGYLMARSLCGEGFLRKITIPYKV
jgi:hypothetical protein